METSQAWQFGGFTLLPAQRLLLDGEAPVRVGGRALDILIVLVQAAGELVRHDELMARVWKKVVVDEGSLRVHIAALRRALGDDGDTRRYIANAPGQGYSFVADVRALAPSNAAWANPVIDTSARRLPPLLVQVIGRDDTIREVMSALAQQRLVTLVGTGGIGKTTAALVAANQLAAQYRDGARFVDLAPLIDPRHVAAQVAHVVANTPLVSSDGDLGDLLAERQMLIVLDNCEHVVEAAAAVAELILSAAPGVRLLATSREPMRAAGECVLQLAPLKLPAASARLTARQALGYSAIQLFTQRAAASLAGFALTDDEVPCVIRICRHLDGIPLAIELAAGRVAQLGLRGLAVRLKDRFSVLNKGRRTALPRQQTLRAAIDWSYELLSGDQKAVLRRLAVFAGAFSFDSAVAVCEDDVSAEPGDAIDELVFKSLINVDAGNELAPYRLLEVTRAYALEKLKDAGELALATRNHAQHVCEVFERLAAESPLDQDAAEAGHARWIDDIQLAVQASDSTLHDPALGVRLLVATASVWYERSLLDEYRIRAEVALKNAGNLTDQPQATLMRLWHSLGHCYWHIKGPHPDVVNAFCKTYDLARVLHDVDFERMALWGLWVERTGSGHHARGLELARMHTALTSPGTAPEVEIRGRHMMQLSLHLSGNQAASRAEAMAALSLIHRMDDHRPLGRFRLDPRSETDVVLARVLWLQGFPDQALSVAAEAVQAARTAQHDPTLCFALFGQCAVLQWCGRWAELGRQANALLEVTTDRRLGFWKLWGQTFKDAHAYGAHGVVVPGWRNPMAGPHQLELMATVSDELLHDDALLRAEAGHSPWCIPEVFRAQGEKLRRQEAPAEDVERWFARALDLARSSDALSWELRAATSLARLWLGLNRRADAMALLSVVLERYTEGFDSLDVQRARQLVEQNTLTREARSAPT